MKKRQRHKRHLESKKWMQCLIRRQTTRAVGSTVSFVKRFLDQQSKYCAPAHFHRPICLFIFFVCVRSYEKNNNFLHKIPKWILKENVHHFCGLVLLSLSLFAVSYGVYVTTKKIIYLSKCFIIYLFFSSSVVPFQALIHEFPSKFRLDKQNSFNIEINLMDKT